jgi:hypothetical protein
VGVTTGGPEITGFSPVGGKGPRSMSKSRAETVLTFPYQGEGA